MSKRLGIVFGLGLVFVGLVYTTANVADDRRKSNEQTQNEVKVNDVKRPSQVKVSLPGTSSIPALKESYTQPTSLWTVVSKDFPLAEAQYRPTDLVVPAISTNKVKSVDEQSVSGKIKLDLETMFGIAKSSGYNLMLASGFRSYELQQYYFNSYSASYGEASAVKFSARPGQSEHQTGFGVDISYENRTCYLETCFGDTPAGQWLAAHAWEYGFILRYPADKTDVTKYQYEPWHFRYVGKDLAKALVESGLTLDEAKPYLDKASIELGKT